MIALATVIEIDNQVTRRRSKTIVPRPQRLLEQQLRKYLTYVDPDSGDVVSIEHDPFGTAPIEACVCMVPGGPIRIVVYFTATTGADERACPDNERVAESDPATLATPAESIDAVDKNLHFLKSRENQIDTLGENLRRLMTRQGVTLEMLATTTGISRSELTAILNKETEATLTEVWCLAEYFGTTAGALLSAPKDQGAGEWN